MDGKSALPIECEEKSEREKSPSPVIIWLGQRQGQPILWPIFFLYKDKEIK